MHIFQKIVHFQSLTSGNSYLRKDMDGRRYISVILPLKLEWEPCYYIMSANLDTSGNNETSDTPHYTVAEVGHRVRVKFAGKEYVGVISGVDITPDIEPKKIQPVLSIERDMEKILEEEIALWRQVAKYYLCTVGEVYKAAYPTSKINLEEARAEAKRKVADRREKMASIIRKRIEALQEKLARKSEQKDQCSDKAAKTKAKLEADILRISEEISRSQISLAAAEKNAEAARCGMDLSGTELPECRVNLTEAQAECYQKIQAGFAAGKPVLLHGSTGSGKTEIYIKAAHEALQKGRNVLYLVPEIALSRQLEDRLFEHFEERLMVFHSGETAASKRNTAEIIRSQKGGDGNYILLGTRSSLFLPHHDLGLIIVDEEHDSSYKQDSPAPRYNGRDTSLMLNQLQNKGSVKCNILLGSATPSLEEMYNCMSGRHALVELNEKYHGGAEAEIEIIDTKAERRKNGMIGNFSRVLIGHINHALENGGQVVILRSRRAWATALQCEGCGEIQKCPHCNVSLSFHKAAGQQKCHYCGKTITHTGICGKCGGSLMPLGAGTQKIEEEAAKLFPNARIARLDSDTAQNKNYEKQTIKAFAKGEIDILIGTQMVTKGFDFENLSLVAAIAADSMLGLQDFRADEKALQLLEQFRGRCGRRTQKGLFVIQTAQPEHPIYQNLSSNDVKSFNLRLMEERKDFNFPPFSRIIEITLKDRNDKRLYLMSSKLAERLGVTFQPDTLTGPYQPVVDKIENEHIRKIRICLRKNKELSSNKLRLTRCISDFENEFRYTGHIILNVDPS